MKEQDITKMELLITLNDSIVVQRLFNVRNYNPNAKNSLEFYECFREIKNDLEEDLRIRSIYYLLDNVEEIMEDEALIHTSMTEGPEKFNLYIKENDVTICHRVINAKLYPPKVRYTVDIRPRLKTVLKTLTDIFSEQKLTFKYLELPMLG